MAFEDFWVSVRAGAGQVAPRVIADAPRTDAEGLERTLREATIWLTPRSVAGFDVADLDFLPDAEREALVRLATEFRRVASEVGPTAPASGEQIERALPLFRDIVTRLEFHRYGDPEAFRLGKLIERAIEPNRPEALAELRFSTGHDSTGDPALWIWAFLSDAASVTDQVFLENSRRIRKMLDIVARRVAPDRWPYLSFRSLSEQAEMREAS